MSRFFISFLWLLSLSISAQNHQPDSLAVQSSDTLVRQPVKVRLGFDVGSYAWAEFNHSHSYNIFADVSFKKNYLAVIEAGQIDRFTETGLLTYRTKGNYIRLGVDYNLYDNWPGMDNEITVGLRYGWAGYAYHLSEYTINQPGAVFPPQPVQTDLVFDNLSAHWLEVVSRLQVETFKHLYVGYTISFKYLMRYTREQDMDTPFIPGFNKRNAYSNFGFGMQYFIAYRFNF